MNNFLYTVFFLVVNVMLYSVLTKAYKISKGTLLVVAVIATIFTILHVDFLNVGPLMPMVEYFGILMFSFALIILHYGSILQVAIFKKSSVYKDTGNKALPALAVKAFDLMRLKIIYILISIYQLLAVWIPEIR